MTYFHIEVRSPTLRYTFEGPYEDFADAYADALRYLDPEDRIVAVIECAALDQERETAVKNSR